MNFTELSKYLSYVLRHKPEAINLKLDSEGWANIADLIEASTKDGQNFSIEIIQQIVASNDKKRFALSQDGLNIRAVQGHSTDKVDLAFKEQIPPDVLFHGTALKNEQSIMEAGLLSQQRHYVHLSNDIETAIAVGKRHGKPIVFEVDTKAMQKAQIKFYKAENGVWLTRNVSSEFLRRL